MKALSHLRLLDLTHILSGPYAGMLLADLGMDTIKVEPPRGEGTRALQSTDPQTSLHGMGAYFLTSNRNKKSITLDLKHEKGLAIFYELVKVSDVVLSNFSAGVTDRLRIGHTHLSAINPRIITCSITGFGETGPGRDRPSFDIVAQAMGGNMSITGQPGGPPTRSGIPIGDLGGGMMGVIGILAAIAAREQTGRGQNVDISMLDTQISMLNYHATMHLLSGKIPETLGNAHITHIPYDAYPCQDGYIIVAIITDNFWHNLMEVVDAPDLNTEENRLQPGRKKNREAINSRLSEIFRTNTQAYWLERLTAARIPCSPVYNLAQTLTDEQVLYRNMVVKIEHALGGTFNAPGNPIKLSEHQDSYASPPLLGEHTEEVLGGLLGMRSEDIECLHTERII
jgi:CoA:oxalate CoA-transferase